MHSFQVLLNYYLRVLRLPYLLNQIRPLLGVVMIQWVDHIRVVEHTVDLVSIACCNQVVSVDFLQSLLSLVDFAL